jgi:hypothetical protein
MNQTVTIRRRIRFRTTRTRQATCQQNARPEGKPGRIPRVARLMALAIRLETLIADGRVPNYAALARLAHVSRARITQITNLTLLAPDIQETVLFLPPIRQGPDPLTERDLRPIVAELKWARQRRLWNHLLAPQSRAAR